MNSILRPQPWRAILRHGVQVVAFCCVVAVFTTMIWTGSSYPRQLVHSLSIGMVTWSTIEFGRLLFATEHCHLASDGTRGWPKGWRGIVLSAAGIAAGFFVGTWVARTLLGEGARYPQRDVYLGLLVTAAAGAVASFYFHARGQAASLQAAKAAAERDATEAHLRLLQSQLEPHMLFNTLANLRALIGVDPAAAQIMVDRMNDYLRATLNASRATSHPLHAEFARLSDYLALLAIRMGPRLRVTLDLPQELRDLPVPPLLLQPLVENAIGHGLEPRVQGGEVRVIARRVGEALQLEVADTGVGFDVATRTPDRFGLQQVFDRVASATGGRGRVNVLSTPGEGTTVRIALPLQSAAD